MFYQGIRFFIFSASMKCAEEVNSRARLLTQACNKINKKETKLNHIINSYIFESHMLLYFT